MGYSAYIVPTSGNPKDLNAARIRAEQRLYEDKFKPLEDRLIRYATDHSEAERQAQAAGAGLRAQFRGLDSALARRMSRYGALPTADQLRVAKRLSLLDAALGETGVENQVRQQVDDEQVQLMGDLGQIGKNIRGGSSAGLSSASRMQSAREQAGKQARAQWRQNLVSSAATGAALGLAAAGTAAGAGLGAGAGLLLALL